MVVQNISEEMAREILLGEISALRRKLSPVGALPGRYVASIRRMSIFELSQERDKLEREWKEEQETRKARRSRRANGNSQTRR
jgi:hypothetical protein